MYYKRQGAIVYWLRQKTHVCEDPGSNPDTAKESICHAPFNWIRAWITNMSETLTWHCCTFCNPANGKVFIEEWLAFKTQLHGFE